VVNGNTVGRAFALADTRLFGIIGTGLYEFDSNGGNQFRATVDQDTNPAQIIYNGIVAGQLGIVSGGKVYSYDLAANTLGGPHLTGGYTHLCFAAGRGLALNPATGKGNVSDLNDLSTWDAGTFFQRSLFADPYQAMFVDANNLVWLIGTETFEVRYDSGTGTQPFIPLSGMNGRSGIAAPFAFSVTGAGNFWLSRTAEGVGEFVMSRGAAPQSVSTFAVNTAIASYLRNSRITDAEMMTYQQEGHMFATVSFPAAQAAMTSAPATWCYDATGQSWARRGRWSNGAWALWAPRVHVYAFGKHLVGDHTSGTIWWMDTSFATDTDGNGIRRVRRAPHLNDEHRRVPIHDFELLMDVGLGLSSGQGSDPQVMMRLSQDGGRTWGNERIAGAGKIGQWRKRVYWNRCGIAPDTVVEVSWSEPVPWRIVDAYINNTEGQRAA
jgi:hypothetical protein